MYQRVEYTKLNTYEFGEYSDVYVVDKGFNWTYVIPHEKGVYGPYFYRK
ncbi:DUF4275 family protein [Ornithinibacillus contaminans]|nr:DUF4275 family protein [Ornithinibacillus contaminans]